MPRLPLCPTCRTRRPRIARPGGLCHLCVPVAGPTAGPVQVLALHAATTTETVEWTPDRWPALLPAWDTTTDGPAPEGAFELVAFDGLVIPGRYDEVTQEVFTQGMCGQLARTLAQRTGWDLWWLTDGEPDDPYVLCGTLHVVAVAPDGTAVDINGHMPVEELIEEWEGTGRRLTGTELAELHADLDDTAEKREPGWGTYLDQVAADVLTWSTGDRHRFVA